MTKPVLGSIISAAVTVLVFAVLSRRGSVIDADGWAMWQGAISLVEGRGYVYFSGHPIVAWPPLYSLYLGVWFLFAGQTALVLLFANGVLLALQAAFWTVLALRLTERETGPPATFGVCLLAVFVGMLVASQYWGPLSHTLVYTLLPLYIGLAWKLDRSMDSGASSRSVVGCVVVGTLLLLTHNACVAFVAAAAAIVVSRWPPDHRRLRAGALVFAVPVLLWVLCRLALGQADSHPFGFGDARESLGIYVAEFVFGLGRPFIFDRAGSPYAAGVLVIVLLVVLAVGRAGTRERRFIAGYVALSAILVFALFNLTWIAAPLSSTRHTFFVSLAILPVAYLVADARRPVVARATLVVALLPLLYWTGLAASGGGVRPPLYAGLSWNGSALEEAGPPPISSIPANAYIDSSYPSGPPRQAGAYLLLAPPPFEQSAGAPDGGASRATSPPSFPRSSP